VDLHAEYSRSLEIERDTWRTASIHDKPLIGVKAPLTSCRDAPSALGWLRFDQNFRDRCMLHYHRAAHVAETITFGYKS
jgi:hypothetical protein